MSKLYVFGQVKHGYLSEWDSYLFTATMMNESISRLTIIELFVSGTFQIWSTTISNFCARHSLYWWMMTLSRLFSIKHRNQQKHNDNWDIHYCYLSFYVIWTHLLLSCDKSVFIVYKRKHLCPYTMRTQSSVHTIKVKSNVKKVLKWNFDFLMVPTMIVYNDDVDNDDGGVCA